MDYAILRTSYWSEVHWTYAKVSWKRTPENFSWSIVIPMYIGYPKVLGYGFVNSAKKNAFYCVFEINIRLLIFYGNFFSFDGTVEQ